MSVITYRPIGVIKTPFKEPKGTPIQPTGAKGIHGKIVLKPEYTEGLKDLEGLSQEEAGDKMGISRGTIWRLLKSARRKTTLALTDGRTIQISENTEIELKETKK